MKSEQNKKSLMQFLCSFEHRNTQLHAIGQKSQSTHEEAKVTLISYLSIYLFIYLLIYFFGFQHSKWHIQVLTDYTDILVLLLYFF